MSTADIIQGHANLFAHQNVQYLDLDYNEWQDVDMEFQWEGLNIELIARVYVKEPMYIGGIDEPRESPTYEFGDITVTYIELIH